MAYGSPIDDFGSPFLGRRRNAVSRLKMFDDRTDLLKDAEDTFYGGGNAPPAPTPTPTPVPRSLPVTMSAKTAIPGNGASRTQPPAPKAAPPIWTPNMSASVLGAVGGPSGDTASTFTGNTGFKAQTHTEMAADIARRNLQAAGAGPQNQSAVSRLPFVSGGYQFPAGSPLPEGFQEDNSGGLTRRVSPVTETQYSKMPFVEGGYVFPAGSQLPEGFQENGGGGLTRRVQQETNNQTVHFLPPGFTSAVGSTGAPNSSPNDIHFLPPGFTAISGTVNPDTKQLQFVPPKREEDGYGSAYQ